MDGKTKEKDMMNFLNKPFFISACLTDATGISLGLAHSTGWVSVRIGWRELLADHTFLQKKRYTRARGEG